MWSGHKGAKPVKAQEEAKPEDEAAEAEAPWQDQYVQKLQRVVNQVMRGHDLEEECKEVYGAHDEEYIHTYTGTSCIYACIYI